MKYTKEQLTVMSDTSVLRKLYELLGFDVHDYEFEGVITIQKGNKVTTAELSPDDIMPLAFEHKICLIDSEIGWISFLFKDTDGDLEFEDANPLRAITCCLILVLQGDK